MSDVVGCMDLSDAKGAALCFDIVLSNPCVSCLQRNMTSNEHLPPEYFYKIQKQLVPEEIYQKLNADLMLHEYKINTGLIMDKAMESNRGKSRKDFGLTSYVFFEQFTKLLGLEINCVVEGSKKSHKETSRQALMLSGLSIVDTNSLGWDQIFEMRRDPEVKKAFQDYRLMVIDEYKDKPVDYIQDSLQRKIDRYNEIAKSWGAKTRLSTLELIFSHKNIGAISGFTTALSGAPLTTAVLAGFSVTFGQIGIHLKKRQTEKIEFLNSDPIRYAVRIEDSINKG